VLFHESVPEDHVVAVAKVMVEAKWHTDQVLTKRSDRLREPLNSSLRLAANQKHISWGGSVENRKYGLPRIENLQAAHAGIRFLSVKPLLEDLGKFNLAGIDGFTVRGESGYGARPMKKEWVVSLRDECKREGVPFFFKPSGGVQKKSAGRKLDGKTYDEFPERICNPVFTADKCLALASKFQAECRNPDRVGRSTLNSSRLEPAIF
jgi:protein gp37